MTGQDWTATFVRLALGAVWLWAAGAKLRDPAGTQTAVRAHKVVPRWAVPAVAWSLPIMEALLGAGLIIGWHRRLLAGASAVLLSLMTVSLLTVVLRREPSTGAAEVGCGCFGSREVRDGQPDRSTMWAGPVIARNLLLASAAATLAMIGLPLLSRRRPGDHDLIHAPLRFSSSGYRGRARVVHQCRARAVDRGVPAHFIRVNPTSIWGNRVRRP